MKTLVKLKKLHWNWKKTTNQGNRFRHNSHQSKRIHMILHKCGITPRKSEICENEEIKLDIIAITKRRINTYVEHNQQVSREGDLGDVDHDEQI